MGCLLELFFEIFAEGLVELIGYCYIKLMQLIVPNKAGSVKAKRIIKGMATVIAAFLIVVLPVGLVLLAQDDHLIKTIGKYMTYCKGFLGNLRNNYPNAKIFVITPIWRKDMKLLRPFGDFACVGDVIEEQAAAFANISVVRGFAYVPQQEELFADLRLHPTGRGFEYYFENLWDDIKNLLDQDA